MAKIFIATPMYGGQCNGVFTKSLISLIDMLKANGHQVVFYDLYNESLITRARNTLTAEFLNTDATHLLFIDADQGFGADGIVKMITEDVPILGAAVPMKGINWERVKKAALDGKPNLDEHTAIYNLNITRQEDLDSLKANPTKIVPVHNIGTGLMLIQRHVFEELKDSVETYKTDQPKMYSIEKNSEVYNFWTLSVDENKRLLSEDYNFCKLWRDKGNQVYLAPYVKVTHAGSYWFK
jgi:hypothetical protein